MFTTLTHWVHSAGKRHYLYVIAQRLESELMRKNLILGNIRELDKVSNIELSTWYTLSYWSML